MQLAKQMLLVFVNRFPGTDAGNIEANRFMYIIELLFVGYFQMVKCHDREMVLCITAGILNIHSRERIRQVGQHGAERALNLLKIRFADAHGTNVVRDVCAVESFANQGCTESGKFFFHQCGNCCELRS